MNDIPIKDITKHKTVSWQEYITEHCFKNSDAYVFRATLFSWDLVTSLERAVKNWNGEIEYHNLPKIEKKLIRDYKRCYPIDHTNLIPGSTLEWMALMQHWGAPTRLLDFTYSPCVACYFALKKYINAYDKNKEENLPTVWRVDTELFKELKPPYIDKKTDKIIKNFNDDRTEASFQELFIKKQKRFVYTANPIRQSSRLTAQKGLFMLAGIITCSFEENLKAIPNWENYIRRYVFKPDEILKIMDSLDKMNINDYTLFPGLDGFSRSYFYNGKFLKPNTK